MIPDINLLPKLERGEKSSKVIFIVLGLVTLLLILYFIWHFISTNNAIERAAAEEAVLQAQRDELQQQIATLQSGNEGSLEESVTFVERVSYAVTPLIDEIELLLPNEYTYLRTYSFSESSVEVAVDFETINAISGYVTKLNASHFFADVQVEQIENFELSSLEGDSSEQIDFQALPRYSATITLPINESYLAAGGATN